MSRIENSYVYVGRAAQLLAELTAGRRVIVVTDDTVRLHYFGLISQFEHITIREGEGAKSLETVGMVYSELIRRGADRTTMLVGIGGGIVTDITGFVGATFMRGVDFGFVATTLLAQVDASLGGKNGVNVGGYKNMAGTFCQPKFVICDVTMLSTLPDREFRAGFAEIIKSAIISNPILFKDLESARLELFRCDYGALEAVVRATIKIKLDIVSKDERESGLRRVLNLGHTIAHAVESRPNCQYNHGEAVAIGLIAIADMARRNNLIHPDDANRIVGLCRQYNFEMGYIAVNNLIASIAKDKKRENDKLHLIVPRAIGRVEDMAVTLDELEQMFKR
jgi:3-dehydroquinate synthase